jgi:hypothetical protein
MRTIKTVSPLIYFLSELENLHSTCCEKGLSLYCFHLFVKSFPRDMYSTEASHKLYTQCFELEPMIGRTKNTRGWGPEVRGIRIWR